MLKDLVNEKLIKLQIEASDWEDAVRKAAQPLVEEGKVKTSYVDDIIQGVKDMGPYIVLTKHVALPHARPESGALESAIEDGLIGKNVSNHQRPKTEKFIGSFYTPEEAMECMRLAEGTRLELAIYFGLFYGLRP